VKKSVKKVTMHLSPEEFVDAAEGTRLEASLPHLAECDRCRRELADLRRTMGVAVDADVPEPSPLFWEHLSTRVREAVAAESAPARSWLGTGRWSWSLAAAMGAVVVVIAVALTVRTPPPIPHAPAAIAEVPGGDVGSAPAADDPSFSLLGDLAGGLDWDAAAEAGISTAPGAVDTAVRDLNDGERTELQRLLREAMATSRVGA
jgi:hypothetical protein